MTRSYSKIITFRDKDLIEKAYRDYMNGNSGPIVSIFLEESYKGLNSIVIGPYKEIKPLKESDFKLLNKKLLLI